MAGKVYIIGRDEVPQSISLQSGERLEMTFVVLPGVSCELPLTISLEGEGAELDIAGLYLCKDEEDVRISVDVRHNSGGCVSRQLFKGIVGGKARAAFSGLVYVKKDAQRTKALQENHTILLTREARVETKPQLEIYADDVECSHGATTGFLNQDEQFYMQSRGIPEAEAKRLQMVSFLAPVLARLDEELREEIVAGI